MSAKFFLDTNVFVYTFDSTAPEKARIASELVRRAIKTREGIVSYQVVQEFFQVAFRRFPQPLSPTEAEQYLTSVFRPLCAVQSSLSLYLDALRLQSKHQLPWYDSLILSAAIQSQCEVLYSEDFQHDREFGGVRIRDPFLTTDR